MRGAEGQRRELTPEVEQAIARARVNMRADLERRLAAHGLTPEEIETFMAAMDERGEALRQATRHAPSTTASSSSAPRDTPG